MNDQRGSLHATEHSAPVPLAERRGDVAIDTGNLVPAGFRGTRAEVCSAPPHGRGIDEEGREPQDVVRATRRDVAGICSSCIHPLLHPLTRGAVTRGGERPKRLDQALPAQRDPPDDQQPSDPIGIARGVQRRHARAP